jgi:hypothetical protein
MIEPFLFLIGINIPFLGEACQEPFVAAIGLNGVD